MKPYYSDDLVTLYNDDCLSAMKHLPDDSADLVFTSPPYNLGISTGGGLKGSTNWRGSALSRGYADHDDAMPYQQYVAWQGEVLEELWRVIKPTGAIYYQHKPRVQAGVLQTPLSLIPSRLPVRQIIIWDRGSGLNFATTHYVPAHEWIVVIAGPSFRLKNQGASGHSDVWRANAARDNDHPAPFPQILVDKAIESTGASVVLDPFAGSGTTLRAAKDAGVRGIGIEKSAQYCATAARRLAQDTLFGGVA